MNIERINKMMATKNATKERRSGQECKTFELKIDQSHLSKVTLERIKRVFLEAKWLYNFALSTEKIFEFPEKTKVVTIKVKDKFEERKLLVLGSQMNKDVIEGLQQNIITLSKRKKKGLKVGKIKFISKYNSINLQQFGNTYRIKGNKVLIQNMKQWMRVHGLDQILNKGFEFANAKFIQKASGYYLKVTCFKKKERVKISTNPQIGLDFGIKTQIALSNGIEIAYQIKATKRMPILCRNFSAKESHSSNWYKSKNKLSKEYEKTTNQKTDIKNKLMHIFKNEFSLVCYQNENIKAWQRIWGKRILQTSIGGITASLKKTPTALMVDRFFPSTKQCPACQHKTKIPLSERVFTCEKCGYTKPRDWKSAEMILEEGLKKIGAERIKLKPVEMQTSTLSLLGKLNFIPRVKASLVEEAGSPTLG